LSLSFTTILDERGEKGYHLNLVLGFGETRKKREEDVEV